MKKLTSDHKDGTIAVKFITLPDGTQVTESCDKTGKCIVESHQILSQTPIDELKEFVKSAELLSKKRLKYRKVSIQKQR